jgi:hypothetical protein
MHLCCTAYLTAADAVTARKRLRIELKYGRVRPVLGSSGVHLSN